MCKSATGWTCGWVGVQMSDGVDVWGGRCANERWGGCVGREVCKSVRE